MTTSNTRTRRGISPLISVDRRAVTPLQRQIYDAFRNKIVSGELSAGQEISSTRGLASELHISRMPVLNAYAQLLAEGYFDTRVGAGTFVSASIPHRLGFEAKDTPTAAVASGRRSIGARAGALPMPERPPWIHGVGAFNLSQPALDVFPRDTWSKLLRRYSRRFAPDAMKYGESLGLQELREAVAAYLRTARGVRCEAQQVMIVSGSQQALDLCTRVLLNAGEPVWMEEPGYWLAQRSLVAWGCRPVPVPVDEEGLNVAAGIKLCRKARAAYVAPSHQFPLGVTMSASRRLQLLDWAHTNRSWIVEDDYDSEYRYESAPIASLQGLDSHSRVIYMGTFSKVLFPSLRVGYLVLPPDLVDRFLAARYVADICPPHIHQAVLAAFIREGHFFRHIRQMRLLYGERRSILTEALRHEFGSDLEVLGTEAGMHVTVRMTSRIIDHQISLRAARQNLWLWPLSPSYFGKVQRHGFILGYGNASAAAIRPAVRLLKRIVTSPA